MSSRLVKLRPFPMGVSISSVQTTAGTAGCLVKRKSDGKLCVLSNWHVLKDQEACLQQGKRDGGSFSGNFVGTSQGIPVPPSGGNVDCSLLVLDSDALVRPDILELGIPKGINTNPTQGMKVKKSGRTTGLTEGEITDTHAVISVDYGDGIRTLEDLILTTAMSQGGDSGSALIDENMNVLGLLFAGSDAITVHCKIQNVLSALQVELATGLQEPVWYSPVAIVIPYSISAGLAMPPPPAPPSGIKTPQLKASLDKQSYKAGEKMLISGAITDPDTQAGLDARGIQARSAGFSTSPWQSISDKDGKFSIPMITLKAPDQDMDFTVEISFAGDP